MLISPWLPLLTKNNKHHIRCRSVQCRCICHDLYRLQSTFFEYASRTLRSFCAVHITRLQIVVQCTRLIRRSFRASLVSPIRFEVAMVSVCPDRPERCLDTFPCNNFIASCFSLFHLERRQWNSIIRFRNQTWPDHTCNVVNTNFWRRSQHDNYRRRGFIEDCRRINIGGTE